MSSEFSPELRQELLDDFYAECDELLAGARETLTSLELNVDADGADAALVENLTRIVHTLKGSAAIVGLRGAEVLAHGVEDHVRACAAEPDRFTIELLMAALQRFEAIVAAHRAGRPMPEVDDLLMHLRSPARAGETERTEQTPARPAPSPAAAPPVAAAAAIRARGLQPGLFSFVPSAALNERGINVDAIRQRLTALGEIVSVTPHVRGKGAIEFEFLVALKSLPMDVAAWERDGVRCPPIAELSQPSFTGGSPATAVLTPSHIVRVDLARLDELMRIGGDLVILRSRLEDRLNQSEITDELREINRGMTRALRDLREAIARVRLVPIAEIFTRMPYVVRDLARQLPQQARVVLEGRHTQIDKYLVERLREPLLHLVRNALSHGIEPPAARKAAGKPPEGMIVLRAVQVGEFIEVNVRDDGRGVDTAAVVARATARGLAVPEQLDADAILALLCAPGFSTRDEADLASGRGVGMAVVATTVRELGGTLKIDTTPGNGTEFTLRVPLMLSIIPAILVSVGEQCCAVPQGFVEEIVQLPAVTLRTIKQTEVIPHRGGLLPVVRLRAIFGRPPADPAELTLVVLKSERGAAGLLVDNVRAQREVVVRALADPLVQVPLFSGATELGDGRPLLVLDPVAVTSGVVRPASDRDVIAEPPRSGTRMS